VAGEKKSINIYEEKENQDPSKWIHVYLKKDGRTNEERIRLFFCVDILGLVSHLSFYIIHIISNI
jgi:hypothetical protein